MLLCWLTFFFNIARWWSPNQATLPEKILKHSWGIEVIYLEVNGTNFQFYWSFKFDICIVQFWHLVSLCLYKTITRMYGTNQNNVRKCNYSFLNISVAIMMSVTYILKCYQANLCDGKWHSKIDAQLLYVLQRR